MVYLTLITDFVVLWAVTSVLKAEQAKLRLALWKCGEHRFPVFIRTHIKLSVYYAGNFFPSFCYQG
jgi:hypothetical protein